jgi:hypothetical protein
MYRAAVTHCYWCREYHFFLRLGLQGSLDLIDNFRLVHPPEPRASVITATIVNRNMKVLIVRVRTHVLSVTLLSLLFRPDLTLENKILNTLVLFEFLEDDRTVNPVLRVMG